MPDQIASDVSGWTRALRDEEILARLVAMNLARAAAQGGAAVVDASTGDDGSMPPAYGTLRQAGKLHPPGAEQQGVSWSFGSRTRREHVLDSTRHPIIAASG